MTDCVRINTLRLLAALDDFRNRPAVQAADATNGNQFKSPFFRSELPRALSAARGIGCTLRTGGTYIAAVLCVAVVAERQGPTRADAFGGALSIAAFVQRDETMLLRILPV